uniref:Uncharacterized protein n=1 Tax=Vitis vinifera TaxID=29760 RepID=F6HZW2_VITVI
MALISLMKRPHESQGKPV